VKEISYYRDTNSLGSFFLKNDLFMWDKEKEQLSQLQPGSSRLTAGDKVYFANNIEYPRFKFRDWGINRDISISRSLDNCTAVIIDTENLHSVLNSMKKVTICKEKVDMYITVNYISQLVNGIVYSELDYSHKGFTENPLSLSLTRISGYKRDIDIIEQACAINNLIQSGKSIKIISYSEFIEQVSEQMCIDIDSFYYIHDMLNSDDYSNRNIGIEMMTNFNINKSPFLLDLLYLMNWTYIERYSDMWNKVTFKPLRNRFTKIFTRGGATTKYPNAVAYLKTNMNIIIDSYTLHDCLSDLDSHAVKILYNNAMKNIDFGNTFILPGIKVEEIVFGLDPAIFVNQCKHLLNEQQEQDNGTSLGDELQEDIEQDISAYCDDEK